MKDTKERKLYFSIFSKCIYAEHGVAKEKRPPSAYNVFVKEKMAELKAKPDFVMKEAMKIVRASLVVF